MRIPSAYRLMNPATMRVRKITAMSASPPGSRIERWTMCSLYATFSPRTPEKARYAPTPASTGAAIAPMASRSDGRNEALVSGQPVEAMTTATASTRDTPRTADSSRPTPLGNPTVSTCHVVSARMSCGPEESREARNLRTRRKPANAAVSMRSSLAWRARLLDIGVERLVISQRILQLSLRRIAAVRHYPVATKNRCVLMQQD